MAKKTKALVMFSGGLDSRLVVKLLKKQNIDVEAVYFALPFGEGCCNNLQCVFNFLQKEGVKLHIIDMTEKKRLKDYLSLIKNPRHGYGVGINPCKDCRIYLFKEAKKLADQIRADLIATGEVLGQRPMSQKKNDLTLIEEEAGLKGKILRPLSAKLLPPTETEKKGLVKREKLLDLKGRSRKKQIELAKKFKIQYPLPAGGCLLCDKNFARKLKDLLEHKKIEEIKLEEVLLLNKGRHFRKNGKIVLGRNKEENQIIESFNKQLNWNIIVPEKPGPTAIFEDEKDRELAERLIEAYSSKNHDLRKKLEKYRI